MPTLADTMHGHLEVILEFVNETLDIGNGPMDDSQIREAINFFETYKDHLCIDDLP